MSRVKQISIATASFATALSIGFVMQNSAAHADRPAVSMGTLTVAALTSAPVLTPPPAEGTAPVLAAVQSTTPGSDLPQLTRPKITPGADAPGLAEGCDVMMTGLVGPAATVDLAVSAPCHRNARATLHHRGMMVSLATDDQGIASVTMPALARDATYILAFGETGGALVSFDVPEVAQVNRAVLQWQGTQGLHVNAYENGATFGTPGHVWKDATRSPDTTEGGFLLRLGDANVTEPLLAEVYTYPAAQPSADVALSVEAEITAENCAQEVTAQSLQIAPGQPIEAVDLTMTMPGCSAVSDILILKNMFEDLKLAAK